MPKAQTDDFYGGKDVGEKTTRREFPSRGNNASVRLLLTAQFIFWHSLFVVMVSDQNISFKA
jgi:hypothetical protein